MGKILGVVGISASVLFMFFGLGLMLAGIFGEDSTAETKQIIFNIGVIFGIGSFVTLIISIVHLWKSIPQRVKA